MNTQKNFKSNQKAVMTECPNCGEDIKVQTPKLGKQVICGECSSVWEVIWLNPLELDWPYDEDLEDDDYGYDDD